MTAPFGVNILSQYVRDRAALLNWLTAAQPACVVCMDDSALTQQIRAVLSKSVVVHRAYNPNDNRWEQATTPQEWLYAHLPFAANGVYIQLYNEPAPGNLNAFLTFLEGVCNLCPSDVRLAFPNFAVGNPLESDILAGKYDRLLRLVCGSQHVLSLHEYFVDDPSAERSFLCGRFAYWQRRARVLGLPEPRIVITEHGRDVGGGVDDGWKGAGWSEQAYYQRLVDAQEVVYDNTMPVAIFCWGTGAANRWQSFDIQDALTLQKALIAWNNLHPITEGTPVPPVPIPPPAPVGAPVPMRVTATAGLKLRTMPDTSAAVVRLMPFGEAVTAYPDTGMQADGYRWIVVTDVQGNTGWAADVYLQKVVQPPPDHKPFTIISPLPKGVITSHFGEPRSYGKHEGTDWALAPNPCAIGTAETVASADGVVDSVRDYLTAVGMDKLFTGNYGLYVRLKHVVGADTYYTWYGHISASLVCVGQSVYQGEPLGILGSTGNSSGYHVHLTVQHIGHGQSGFVVQDVIDPETILVPS